MRKPLRIHKPWLVALAITIVALGTVISVLVFATGDSRLTATAYSDVIRFRADGVATLQVRIFDLSGKAIWDSGVVSGDIVDWDRRNDFGERLAYGAYIYSAQGWNAEGDLIFQKNGKLALMPGDKVQLQVAPAVSSARRNENPELSFGKVLRPLATYNNEDLILNNGSVFYQRNSTNIYKMGISGVGGYQFMDLQGGNKFYIVKSTGAATSAFDFDTGALSLGSLNHNGLLYVAGESYYDGNLFYRRDGVNRYKMGISGVGGFQFMDLQGGNKFYIVNSTGRATATFDFDTGKLGIGTTNPNATLEVHGSATNLLALYDPADPSGPKFTVSKTGEVRADGAYYSGTGGFHTGYADVAERINVSEWVEAGYVVEIDPDHPGFFRKSSSPYSTKVAGIISTSPGVILGNSYDEATDEWKDNRPVLAIAGRVPLKATSENGSIQIGDLLVSSSTPGVAMKGSDPAACMGAVVGKAMEPLEKGTGTIVIQVMLR